jgi:hypothetical protein
VVGGVAESQQGISQHRIEIPSLPAGSCVVAEAASPPCLDELDDGSQGGDNGVGNRVRPRSAAPNDRVVNPGEPGELQVEKPHMVE